MSLPTDDVLLIYREVMLGIPPTLNSSEAQRIRASIVEDRRIAKEKGVTLDVPFELGAL